MCGVLGVARALVVWLVEHQLISHARFSMWAAGDSERHYVSQNIIALYVEPLPERCVAIKFAMACLLDSPSFFLRGEFPESIKRQF